MAAPNFLGAGPGCGCNCEEVTCVIQADDFSGDLAGFTQVGTVSIGSGVATLESGEGLIFTNTPTNATDPVILTAVAETADGTATLRMMVAADDEDNGLYGEYAISGGVGTLVVGSRVSGTNTPYIDPIEVEDTTDLGDSTTYTLCWVPGPVQEGGSFNIGANPTSTVSGDGWASPENISVDDGSWASYLLLDAGTTTELVGVQYNFTVPPGSTIDGIGVGIEARYTDLGGSATLTTMRLFNGDGDVVGDNNGTGQAVTEQPASSVISAGGATDDWNAGLTWEDINSPSFGAYVEFTTDGGAIVEVDYMLISIYFTTPDRQPGRLTFSRGNVTVATVDCAREFSAESPGTGKKAVVVSAAGTWPVDSATYSYHLSDAKPTCPECECAQPVSCAYCCDPESPPVDSYVVDLGAGGWTDDDCDGCNEIAGEFLVDLFEASGNNDCRWTYSDYDSDCGEAGVGLTFIDMSLQQVGEDCRWVVAVYMWRGLLVGGGAAQAVYHSSTFDDGDCATWPVTLSKVSDNAAATTICGGAMPATISIDLP